MTKRSRDGEVWNTDSIKISSRVSEMSQIVETLLTLCR